MTWNIQNLGGSKSDETILEIAKIINKTDVVAIQEVVAKDPRGAKAVAKLADELNRMGNKWDYAVSNPTHSPTVYISERYAYIWRTSKLQLIKRPELDKELEEVCYREPYVASFKIKKTNKEITIVNFHCRKYNDKPELGIQQLIKYSNLPNGIIVGDFNLSANHQVWQPFYDNGFKKALHNQKTTLKRKCKNGELRNHDIDNIFIKSKDITIKKAEVVNFVTSCDELPEKRKLSDHLPVMVELLVSEQKKE